MDSYNVSAPFISSFSKILNSPINKSGAVKKTDYMSALLAYKAKIPGVGDYNPKDKEGLQVEARKIRFATICKAKRVTITD